VDILTELSSRNYGGRESAGLAPDECGDYSHNSFMIRTSKNNVCIAVKHLSSLSSLESFTLSLETQAYAFARF